MGNANQQATHKTTPARDMKKEQKGWFYLVLIMLLFPLLFFFCVFFPIQMGWTPRFP